VRVVRSAGRVCVCVWCCVCVDAARQRVFQAVLSLIKHCCIDINAGATPLYAAIRFDQPQVVGELMQRAREHAHQSESGGEPAELRLGHFDKFGKSVAAAAAAERVEKCVELGLVTYIPLLYAAKLPERRNCALELLTRGYEESIALRLVREHCVWIEADVQERVARHRKRPAPKGEQYATPAVSVAAPPTVGSEVSTRAAAASSSSSSSAAATEPPYKRLRIADIPQSVPAASMSCCIA
jgi:hypothetical protein